MNRRLDISRIAPLRDYLTEVRRGDTITVTEDGTPVASIAAPEHLQLTGRPATTLLADYEQLPPLATDVDVMALLAEERGDR
jgi:antitoxin (DNA-binding transcriptional repressor) of toxin-antitoxin stability system